MQLFVLLMSYHRVFYTQAKSSGLLTSAYRMYNTCILFVCVCVIQLRKVHELKRLGFNSARTQLNTVHVVLCF